MAQLAIPAIALCEAPGETLQCFFAARAPQQIAGVASLGELVVDKTTAGEAPHPHARVWVLRLLDGKKVWEGFADAGGRWQAEGLQPGLEYVAVGIDPQRVFKATAAGPVKASVGASLVDAQEGSNG